MTKFLSCTNMTGGYGGEDIIHSCDIEVDKSQIVVIVGPNLSLIHISEPTRR